MTMHQITARNLVDFATARLSEDEQAARKAIAPKWEVSPTDRHHVQVVPAEDAIGPSSVIAYVIGGESPHIARHDPARALRQVEAMRKILQLHAEECCAVCLDDVQGCPTYRAVASVWSDHPDYQEAWRV